MDESLTSRYDIFAKTDERAPLKTVKLMLRNLLAERFKLSLHRTVKPIQVQALTVGAGGPRLMRPSEAEGPKEITGDGGKHRSLAFKGTMAEFASLLSTGGSRVVDQTGLTGRYEFVLDYGAFLDPSPDARLQGGSINQAWCDAAEARLGLKLVPKKLPLEFIVVDHAEVVPAPN